MLALCLGRGGDALVVWAQREGRTICAMARHRAGRG